MTIRRNLCPAVLLLSVAAGYADPAVLLDESAYWRYYLQGGPMRIPAEAMKRDGEMVLGKRGLERLQREALKRLTDQGRKTDDWMGEVYYPSGYLNLQLMNKAATTPPPAEWMAVDFDDADWSCYRKPFKMAKDFYLDGFVDHFYHIKAAYFRSRFELPDPRAAGELRLRLMYRGGVRAFLNGREIARGHVPQGPLGPEALAEPYPPEAYWALKGEHPAQTGPRLQAWQVATENLLCPDMNVFARRPDEYELQPASDKVPGPYRQVRALGYHGRCWITRAGWDRIRRLRNRTLDVPVPPGVLRKGPNVLAVEVRTSPLHPVALRWGIAWEGSTAWKHGWLMQVRLIGRPEAAAPVARRPPGVQVWAVDVHHRLYSTEFRPPGEPVRRLRIAGARNGTYSAQLAVGTDRALKGLRAAVGQFRPAGGGAALPSSIADVLYPVGHPEWLLRSAGEGKGAGEDSRPGFTRGNAMVMLDRHSPLADIVGPVEGEAAIERQRRLQERELKRIRFFDHLSPRPIDTVPADTCQPIWVRVRVPEGVGGRYEAAVTVSAEGMEPVNVPLELEVSDWRMPDAADFQTVMALEQSSYAVARHYKLPAWSDEHFRRMAKSFELLAGVGNDFLAIPLIGWTEIGNADDFPLRITRKRSGELAFDFSVVDRYVDLALRHWGGRRAAAAGGPGPAAPRVICFIVDHCGRTPHPPVVRVTDEAAGNSELLKIGDDAPPQRRRDVWRAIATAVYDHMRRRGLERSMYWGLHGDGVNDPTLPRLLAEFVPQVTWVRYSHQYRPDDTYTFCANVRGGHFLDTTSRRGWRALTGRLNLWLPRHWNSMATCEGKSAPFAYRLGIERVLTSGGPGAARIGADYWDSTWLHGFGLSPYTGMPILSVFWPGPDGAEPSVRFEMLREGLQETEARIFLEQALEKLRDPKLARRITDLLDRRIHDTLFPPVFVPHVKIEEYHTGWQGRSRALYEAAAEVARRLGVDLARDRIEADVPARGRKTVAVRLRNWTGRPRAWRLTSQQDWLRPERRSGTLSGSSETVAVSIDPSGLEPGETAVGTLTLTDAATGRAEPLEVAAGVSEVFGFTGPETVRNVPVAGQGELAFTLLNTSARPLAWRIGSSVPWAKVSPDGGDLPPGQQCPVRVRFTPPDTARARRAVDLLLTESGGAERHERLIVHVLPARKAPKARPAGEAVPLESVPIEQVRRYVSGGREVDLRNGVRFHKPDPRQPLAIGRKSVQDWNSMLKQYQRGIAIPPAGELTYDIAGRGVRAFSAEVGWSNRSQIGREARQVPRLHFEIYVDGRLAAHSGLMDLTDPPRLLVAEGLADAKEIRLVTRYHNDGLGLTSGGDLGRIRVEGVWGEPAFHR